MSPHSTTPISLEALAGGLIIACLLIAFLALDLFRVHMSVNILVRNVGIVMQDMEALRMTVASIERM